MKTFGQRLTGWLLVLFFFLLPVKFGTLGLMPEQPSMFPDDLFTMWIITWPVYFIGIAGALLLGASVLFFPAPRWKSPGGLTALFWGLLLPLATFPGILNATNRDYALIHCVHWWSLGAFILSTWWVFSAQACWKKYALNALAAGVLFTGIEGWRQYIWGFDEMVELIRKQREAGMDISRVMEIRILDARVFSSLGSCNTFAGFLLLTMPAVFILVREWGKRFEPVKVSRFLFSALALLLLVPPFFMTRSRGAWLCAFLTAGIWFFTRPRIPRKYKLFCLAAGVFAIAAGGVLVARSGRGFLSGTERLDYLRSTAIMCSEHPFAGSGWGEFFHRHMKLKTTDSDESARSPHNPVASFACQAGIPAGVVMLGAIMVLLLELFRRQDESLLYRVGRWGVAAFLLHSCMEINDSIPASVICCAALTMALAVPAEAEEEASVPGFFYRRGVALAAFAVAFWSFFLAGCWLRGEAAFEKLELAMRPRNVQEKFVPAPPARIMELLRECEALRPRSPYPLEIVGDFLLSTGDVENAATLFERSRTFVPGRPAVHRRLALCAALQGDAATAKKHLAAARELFPADPKNLEKNFFAEVEKKKIRFSL